MLKFLFNRKDSKPDKPTTLSVSTGVPLRRTKSTLFINEKYESIKRFFLDKSKSSSAPDLSPSTVIPVIPLSPIAELKELPLLDMTESEGKRRSLSPITPTSRMEAILLAESIFKDVVETLRRAPSVQMMKSDTHTDTHTDTNADTYTDTYSDTNEIPDASNDTLNDSFDFLDHDSIKDAEMQRLHQMMLESLTVDTGLPTNNLQCKYNQQ